MKKKLLICLAMLVCILGLTACGTEMTENSFITKSKAKEDAESFCETLGAMQQDAVANEMSLTEYADEYAAYMDQMIQMYGGSGLDIGNIEAVTSAQVAGLRSLSESAEEFGNFVSVLPEETEVVITEDKADVKVTMQGDKIYKDNKQRKVTVEIVMVEGSGYTVYDSITVSVAYDMSELMTKAGLNTLLGMGTVFAVLILISLLISSFNLIPKIQEKFRKKPAQAESAPAPVQAAVEEETDDTELIAVIAAAIAASEGTVSADGYVVRSIIRR